VVFFDTMMLELKTNDELKN